MITALAQIAHLPEGDTIVFLKARLPGATGPPGVVASEVQIQCDWVMSRAGGRETLNQGLVVTGPSATAFGHNKSTGKGSWKPTGGLPTNVFQVLSVTNVCDEPSSYWIRIVAMRPAGPPVLVALTAK